MRTFLRGAETLYSQSQPEESGEKQSGEDCPGEDVPDPFRDVGFGHLDGDGDFPGDSDDFLFFGDFCRDGKGGAFVLDAVAKVAAGDGGGGCGKGSLDCGCRVGRGDDDRLNRKGRGDDGVAYGQGASDGGCVVNCDCDDSRTARYDHDRDEDEKMPEDSFHSEICALCIVNCSILNFREKDSHSSPYIFCCKESACAVRL